ncbi:MAG: alcohol dehydrogenase [Subtercola sp.]|nr:alcohol dehydrogenase [Subtercola sp.]
MIGWPTRVAVIRPGAARLSVEDAVVPPPGPHQAVVRITATGVCHSQLHQISGALAAARKTAPRALGHEAVGVVIEVGSAVEKIMVGDDVLVGWIPRGSTLEGRTPEPATAVLGDGVIARTPDIFTWSEFTVADECYLFPLERAPEPALSIVGCAVPTGAGAVRNTAAVQPGDTVAIIGVGGVGCSAVAAAKALGAAEVFAIDLDPNKLEFAASMGASILVDSSLGTAEQIVADWASENDRRGLDVVIDCVGVDSSTQLALRLVRPGEIGISPGGTVVLVGVPRGPLIIDGRDMQLSEKRLVGSFGGSSVPEHDYPDYLRWCEDKTIDLDRLVTRYYPFADLNEAVSDLQNGRILGRGVVLL